MQRAYRLTPFLIGRGNVARIYDDGTAAQLWRPTFAWHPNETFWATFWPLAYRPGDRIGLGAQAGEGAGAVRLRATGDGVTILDSGHVVLLGPLP